MNPPFTRQERLPTDYKDALVKRLQVYEDYLHGQLGLYGYFIFLADKFTKEDGKIALVLPATVLRVKSAKGIRRLLTANYQIEHIITTWQRAAFSEGAQFREILLVAKKLKSAEDIGRIKAGSLPQCSVTILKRLPTNLQEANHFATKIKEVSSSIDETFEDENMVLYKVPQLQLRTLVDNLFTLIALQNPLLIDSWMKASAKAGKKLMVFSDYLKDTKGQIKEGIESRRGGKVQSLTILADESMAIKKSDVWVVSKIREKSLTARHRFLSREINIPLNSVYPALRRTSGVKRLDINDNLDYVISKKFPELEEFLEISTGRKSTRFIEKWRKYVEERLGNFIVVRRMDISASGSALLAFYSSIPEAPPGISWSIKIPSDEEAKILSLFFNSSLNILQTLVNRKETRGAFLQIDEYTLEKFQVVNPQTLSEKEKRFLLKTFDEVKDTDFPSILEQLKTKFPARLTIDKALLRVLGFGDDEINRLLDYLYPALANEIQQPINS